MNIRRTPVKPMRILASVTIIMLFILLATVFNTDGVNVKQTRHTDPITKIEDITVDEIQDQTAPIGIRKQYTFTLEDNISQDISLAFYTVHQYVTVWIDGKEVYSINPSADKRITKTVASNWVMIPLYSADSGKKVDVQITPVYESFRNRKIEFLTGSPEAIFQDRLLKDLPQLVLGGMAVLTGIVFLCIAICGILRKKQMSGLSWMGIFSVMIGIWRLTDTRSTPFMDFGRPVFIYYINLTMLMLGLLPLLQWTKMYFNKTGRKVIEIYETAALCLAMLQFILQYFKVIDIRETMTVTHIVMGIGMICLVAVVVYEIKCEQGLSTNSKIKFPLEIKLAFICVAGIFLDIIAFYIKGNSSGLIFTLLTFLIYIICMGILSIQRYNQQQAELAQLDRQVAQQNRELAAQERKLTDSRIKAMMSQIRSHFIFNVLATISTYCKIDPKEADKALICFSRYLRRNIQNIEEDGLIDFSLELEQVKDYVTLEQLRFADRITFVTDVETTSFQIPPLTIQPLVENAIKHGIIEHGISGTITLYTKKLQGEIEIKITDNGVGFDLKQLEKAESVGIRNVKYRIENMTGGTIAFESIPDKGTTVTIHIPDGVNCGRIISRNEEQ